MELWFKVLLPHDAHQVGDVFSVDVEATATYEARVKMGLLQQLQLPVDSGAGNGKQRKARQGKGASVRNEPVDSVRGESGVEDRVGGESDGSGSQAE